MWLYEAWESIIISVPVTNEAWFSSDEKTLQQATKKIIKNWILTPLRSISFNITLYS